MHCFFVSKLVIMLLRIIRKGGARRMEKLQDIELKKILTELADMLQKVYQEKLKAVILYGSVARGTATDESDIDIMVLWMELIR